MAETNVRVTNQPEVAALHAVLYASKVYGIAKSHFGSLKPGMETIEGTLKTVVSPAYHKFHDVPVDVLKFVDRKVDESVRKLDSLVSPLVEQVSVKTKNFSTMASEVKNAGVVETASGLVKTAYTKLEPTAKGLYTKYEPTVKGLYSKYEPTAKGLYIKYEQVAEQYVVSAWQSLNQLPYFPKVANVVVPKAAYLVQPDRATNSRQRIQGFFISTIGAHRKDC